MDWLLLIAQFLVAGATAFMAFATCKMVKATKKTLEVTRSELEVMRSEFAAERLPRVAFFGAAGIGQVGPVFFANFSKGPVYLSGAYSLAKWDEEASSWRYIRTGSFDSARWMRVEPGEVKSLSISVGPFDDFLDEKEPRYALSFLVFYPDHPCGPLECFAALEDDFTIGKTTCLPYAREESVIPMLGLRFADVARECENKND